MRVKKQNQRFETLIKGVGKMNPLFFVGFIGAVLALLFAGIQRSKVMSFSEGTDKMKKIAASIREGVLPQVHS